jgi:apolipoprotein N-acyltransferase
VELRRSTQRVGFSRPFVDIGWRRWGFGLSVPLVALIYGMIRIVQVDEMVHHAPKIKIGIVQANMSLLGKRQDLKEGRERHLRMTERLIEHDKVDLVVWPETSIAGAVAEEEAAAFYRKHITKRVKVPLIFGAILARDVDDERDYVMFNSALMSDGKGSIHGRYDKQYLVPFSEYIPFGDDYPILYGWSPHSSRFSPGTIYDPLPFRDQRIATFICYEDIIPHFVNRLMREQNPQLLVNMTNDAWFGDTSEPWEHMALAKLRSVEQRRYLVRSTNSGISGFVDPVGRLTHRTATFQQTAVSSDVALLDGFTVYRLVGDIPFWLLALSATAMSFVRRPQRGISPPPDANVAVS